MPEYRNQAAWKIRATDSSEILAPLFQTTQHYMPKDPNICICRGENLKSHIGI
jgi:hypothetical protein